MLRASGRFRFNMAMPDCKQLSLSNMLACSTTLLFYSVNVVYLQKLAHEPFSGGCYAAIMGPLLLSSPAGPYMFTSVGAIHWAGTEAATVWNDYFEGAVQAGMREAVVIVKTLATGCRRWEGASGPDAIICLNCQCWGCESNGGCIALPQSSGIAAQNYEINQSMQLIKDYIQYIFLTSSLVIKDIDALMYNISTLGATGYRSF